MSQMVLVYDRCKTIGYANMIAIVFQIDNKRNFFKRTKVKTELSEFPFSGKDLQDRLDEVGITLNKNCIPNDQRSPKETSGVRIGTAPMTTRGYNEEDFREVARKIDAVIQEMK